jgi:hypothetical protein
VGRHRNPARRNEGNRATVCATTPRVVPIPRIWTQPPEIPDAPLTVLFDPSATRYRPPTTITTRLLMTGVHIGAANRPRVFRTAPIRELMP